MAPIGAFRILLASDVNVSTPGLLHVRTRDEACKAPTDTVHTVDASCPATLAGAGLPIETKSACEIAKFWLGLRICNLSFVVAIVKLSKSIASGVLPGAGRLLAWSDVLCRTSNCFT